MSGARIGLVTAICWLALAPAAAARDWPEIVRSASPADCLVVDGEETFPLDGDLPRLRELLRAAPASERLDAYGRFNRSGGDRSRADAIRDRSAYRITSYAETVLPADLDWSENPFTSRTWQWGLHSLFPVRYLLGAHLATGDDRYLDKAVELTVDWTDDNLRVPPPSAFSWHDHAAALRLLQMLVLWARLDPATLSDEALVDLLLAMHVHGEVLLEEPFYTRRTNHGLTQSLALLVLGTEMPLLAGSERWRRVGRERLADEIAFMYTTEGVHKENSPAYHVGSLRDLDEVEVLVGEGFVDPALRAGAYRYLQHALMPDGRMPLFGDTTGSPVRIGIPPEIPHRERIRYALTQGRSGERPPEDDATVFLPESGYAFLRDAWHDAESFADTVHFAFKARNIASYHRQSDNLSFVLYGYGGRWICDSGRYLYEPKDPHRHYMRGPFAHNIVIIGDGSAQSLGSAKFARSGLVLCGTRHDGAWLRSFCEYPGRRRHEREVVYRRPAAFLLRDLVTLPDGEPAPACRVLFHVEPGRSVEWADGSYVVRGAGSEAALVIRPLLEPGRLLGHGIIEGATEPRVQGWVSRDGTSLVAAPVVYLDVDPDGPIETLLWLVRSLPDDPEDVAARSEALAAELRTAGEADR